MLVRAAFAVALVVLVASSVLAEGQQGGQAQGGRPQLGGPQQGGQQQGGPQLGGPQRGGPQFGGPQRGRAMPPQGQQVQLGQVGGPPRGPMGDEEIVGNNLGEAALRERLTAGFDANENGQLEREECARAIAAIRNRQALAAQGVAPVVSEQDIVQMFDADGNGQLSVPEYTSACRSMDTVLGEGASRQISGQGQGGGQGGRGGFGGGGQGGGRMQGGGGRGGRGGGGGGRGR